MKEFFLQHSLKITLVIVFLFFLFATWTILTGSFPRYPNAILSEYCSSSGYFHKPNLWSFEFNHCYLTLDSQEQFQNWYVKNRFWPFDYLPGRDPNFPKWNFGHLSLWAEKYTISPDMLIHPPWIAIEIKIIYMISFK
jgi:hypothetical protein